ncbi:21093_t:CDS:1 [Dentiscutata erythropus]|uniref:21093_t:CDS:1 n=1 Tax=Dentiscutata erythropus TaxID=1348616 RepID=A0A9N8ZUU4_9GLOM|nr:21093_t:CDS:1 [Dentiscutata erythropus]
MEQTPSQDNGLHTPSHDIESTSTFGHPLSSNWDIALVKEVGNSKVWRLRQNYDRNDYKREMYRRAYSEPILTTDTGSNSPAETLSPTTPTTPLINKRHECRGFDDPSNGFSSPQLHPNLNNNINDENNNFELCSDVSRDITNKFLFKEWGKEVCNRRKLS